MTVENGRQVSPTIAGIREDHVKRYKFAADVFASMTIIDAACGIGYGSKMLTERGCKVYAYDIEPEAIAYSRWHYRDPNVIANVADIQEIQFPDADAAISFETIEHLPNPEKFLIHLRESCSLLIGSVPNQDIIPYDPNRHKFHVRHYNHQDLAYLLTKSGWKIEYIWSQQGKYGEDAEVTRNPIGATLLFGASSSNGIFPKVSI